MENKDDKLFAEFPPVSICEWEAKIKEDLKGADYEKRLIKKSLDNIRIKPYYTAGDLISLKYLEQLPGSFPFVRGSNTASNTWEIRQDIKVFDVEAAAQKAKTAVEHGATSIGFDITNKGGIYYPEFRKLIDGFDTHNISLNFIAGENSPTMLDFLVQAISEQNFKDNDIKGSIDFDPLGYLTSSGGFYVSESDDFTDASNLLSIAKKTLPCFRILSVNSCLFGNSGSSTVQELAFGLSMAAEYVSRLTEMGHNTVDIARHLQWNIGTGSDYFIEIAKIRAARMLFSTLLAAFDNKSKNNNIPVFIHSKTTNWNKTIYDSNINMLRLTTEAMSAILGGCNSLLVQPYDSCYKETSEFSDRIARNVQVILKEESYFNKVTDPTAGSYYIESLTDSLIEEAWKLFLKTDEIGGYVKAFIKGFVGEEINKTALSRLSNIASKREILLGTNQYPNANEKLLGQIDEEISFCEATENTNRLAEPLLPYRAATGFEKLRLAVEKNKDKKPGVFILTIGNLAMRLARSQFSCNFFACAGYEVIDNIGFQSAREGVDAAFKANADIIVVCSSDEEYAQVAPEVAQLVNGKAIVVVAGAPACMEELKQKGIEHFIHVRSNVLETLTRFNKLLGIA